MQFVLGAQLETEQQPMRPVVSVKQVPVTQKMLLLWSQYCTSRLNSRAPGRRPKSSSWPMPSPGYAVGRTYGKVAGEVMRWEIVRVHSQRSSHV